MIEGADWDGPESYAVCKLAGEVARKFPPGVRQLSQLEWTKHEAIKSLPTDLRVQVLMQAAGDQKYWTVTRLRTERRKRRSPHWGKADGKDIVADIETLILLLGDDTTFDSRTCRGRPSTNSTPTPVRLNISRNC